MADRREEPALPPCPKCGSKDVRYDVVCRDCQRERQKQWRAEHLDQARRGYRKQKIKDRRLERMRRKDPEVSGWLEVLERHCPDVGDEISRDSPDLEMTQHKWLKLREWLIWDDRWEIMEAHGEQKHGQWGLDDRPERTIIRRVQ